MRKNFRVADEEKYVDIYTEPFFQGRRFRLRTATGGQANVLENQKVPRIGSIVVGPEAIAEFEYQGGSTVSRLKQRTVLGDVSKLTKKKTIQRLRITSANI